MKTRTLGNLGFTLIEIMIVVATIGMLAAVAIPNYVKARGTSQKHACIDNLRQLDGAIQQWALENKKAATAPVTLADAIPYLRNTITCQAGGSTIDDSYSVATPETPPTCIAPGGKAANGHVLPQ